jgi:hypothetical protein
MLTDSRFWLGVGFGLIGVYAYHRFVGIPGGGKKAS